MKLSSDATCSASIAWQHTITFGLPSAITDLRSVSVLSLTGTASTISCITSHHITQQNATPLGLTARCEEGSMGCRLEPAWVSYT